MWATPPHHGEQRLGSYALIVSGSLGALLFSFCVLEAAYSASPRWHPPLLPLRRPSRALAPAASPSPPPHRSPLHTSPPPPRLASPSAALPPAALNASRPPRRRREPIDICFLALGPPQQIHYTTSIIRNVRAHSAARLRFHLLVDKAPERLRKQMMSAPQWRRIAKSSVYLHPVQRISSSTRELYRKLSSTATGPGPIYLYKPLLHLVLPAWISRLIVLDTDLFIFTDIAALWRQFDLFAPGELLGVATEQCPSYQEVRALGGVGVNGGVQLLALDAMRQSAHYSRLLATYSDLRASKVPMKPGGIGWLGDQTLYSWMTVNGTGGRQVFHLIPCGWNRQIGTHMAGWKGFWEANRCDGPCNLLHGNYVGHKQLMESLKEDPTGASCSSVVKQYKAKPQFRRGTPDRRMLDMVGATCCR